MRQQTRFLMMASLLAVACGPALVDDRYGGEPELTLRGRFEGSVPRLDGGPHLRGAIFWNPRGTAPFASFDELIEQPASGRDFDFPGLVQWSLFELPGSEHLVTTASGARYGVGLPLLYSDANGNRRRDPGEAVVVQTPTAAVVFAPQPLATGDSPTGLGIPAGYRVVSTPIACSPAPTPAGEGDCGVPLGAACQANTDCGAGGRCLADGPWLPTDGLCAIPEPPPNGCRPRAAALFRDPRDTGRAFWVQACREPADCARGFPFQCDFTFGACLPTAYVLFHGEHALQPRSLCATAP